MPIPRCDTCPWWTKSHDGANGEIYGECHHNDGCYQIYSDGCYYNRASYWCGKHPDAPKPFYDACVSSSLEDSFPVGEGWEPINIAVEQGTAILWRRVTGYSEVIND